MRPARPDDSEPDRVPSTHALHARRMTHAAPSWLQAISLLTRPIHRSRVAATLTAVALLTGCASDDGQTVPARTDVTAPSDTGLGEVLDAASFSPHGPGFVWQLDDAVLITTTSGTPLGHLPEWMLDRGASDRLATAILTSPDGTSTAVTADGLVAVTEPLPLADGAWLHLAADETVVTDRAGEAVARLTGDPSSVWVSATGSVVGIIDGVHWDVEEAAALAVDPGCRVADRHDPGSALLVCDDGTRLAGGTDIMAPDGTRFGWVTVGTTGDEILATVAGADGPTTLVGSRASGEAEVRVDPGVGLFYRSNGAAWVAHLGPDTGLGVLTAPGDTERLRDVPPASDAMVFVR